jgi:nitroreductase
MNQVIETILQRRSIRFYQSKPVPRDILDTIILAGNSAPTGAGSQLWRFVVVEDADFRKKLAALALPRYQKWMDKAPTAFKELRTQIDSVVHDPIYYNAPAVVFVIGKGMTADFDTPMVCENMMIAAQALGLGSCWVYFGQLVLDDAGVRTALGLTEGERVYGPILLGYPAEEQPPQAPKNLPVVKWI